MSEEYLTNLTDEQTLERLDDANKKLLDAERRIEMGQALKKLKASDEYKLVFNSGYFDEFAQKVFKEMTNPPQFAIIPLQDCEDTLLGIKALKSYVGFEAHLGEVELEAQKAESRKTDAQSVLDAIG